MSHKIFLILDYALCKTFKITAKLKKSSRQLENSKPNAVYSLKATIPYVYVVSHFCKWYCYFHLQVTYAKPVVQEIEVPTPVYKQVVEKVPLAPLCQNHLGYAVPCL